jgi:hypothetical protein
MKLLALSFFALASVAAACSGGASTEGVGTIIA